MLYSHCQPNKDGEILYLFGITVFVLCICVWYRGRIKRRCYSTALNCL